MTNAHPGMETAGPGIAKSKYTKCFKLVFTFSNSYN